MRERRRRRRTIALVGVVVALVLSVPLALAAAGLLAFLGGADTDDSAVMAPDDPDESPGDTDDAPGDTDDAPGDTDDAPDDTDDAPDDTDDAPADPEANDGDSSADVSERPDRQVPPDERIEPPELGGLDGDDARIAEMLLDIDASERTMLGFQLDARDAFIGGADLDMPDDVFDAVAAAASRGLEDLEILRTRLSVTQDDPVAEQVRDAYVAHMLSWVRYLEAVEEEPGIVLDDTVRYTIDINRTGNAFVRAVEDLTATPIDREVARFADDLVERGFRGTDAPQA